ncbi:MULTISPECIES: NAD(P)/FAD-dependent oxidoreductase [Exiguobacterium]|uniref:NAD(P)/FAD-dependent oxidoreductase n=1 Tax=Exiguobacterium TaxID=33986 RepID=UPI0020368158|nr:MULTISPECIES: FAD-dependent oxidoreductase [Exiguobacterium]MCT4784673.1 FAD-dependent oxidoreductase [Exiguobacterium himgiriensis]
MRIGIIGAGLSAIVAAQELVRHGHTVELIEKSRSVGGRLATRRIGDGKADHGAVYFTVRGEALNREVNDWLERGWVRVWYADPYPRYVAEGGMNALAKRLAQGLTVHLNERAEAVTMMDEAVIVRTDVTTRPYDRLLITSPLPQTLDLLEAFSVNPALRGLTYAPTFVGLFEFERETVIGVDGIVDTDLPPGILKIINNRQKGISATELVSVYMDEAWSAAWYDREEEETLQEIERLLQTGTKATRIQSRQLKRWRYAQATDVWYEPFYQLERHPIYLAGDVFLEADDASGRTRFESAYVSGLRVATAMND